MNVQFSATGRRPIIAGNWKMFKTRDEAKDFTKDLFEKTEKLPEAGLPEIVIAPPFTALHSVRKAIKKLDAPFYLAGQTMESRDSGAYTGEISPPMLKDLDANRVIVGHSERRQYYNETDASVNAKTLAALAHGMTPIVCVGETLVEREAGQTDAVIARQVEAALVGVDAQDFEKLVFAYEPVWAIGTGKVCEADEANRVCRLIRETLSARGDGSKTRVLYGGSVKPDNIQALMAQSDIDGALVGGASLEADSFFALIQGAMPMAAKA